MVLAIVRAAVAWICGELLPGKRMLLTFPVPKALLLPSTMFWLEPVLTLISVPPVYVLVPPRTIPVPDVAPVRMSADGAVPSTILALMVVTAAPEDRMFSAPLLAMVLAAEPSVVVPWTYTIPSVPPKLMLPLVIDPPVLRIKPVCPLPLPRFRLCVPRLMEALVLSAYADTSVAAV